MRPRLRFVVVAVGVAAAAAAIGIVAAVGGDPAATANLWVDRSGGTCAREARALEYGDGTACGTLDAAWDAARPGDTIRVKAGRYGAQSVTGNKAAATRVIGEDGTAFTAAGWVSCGYQGGALCANADGLVLEHVTLDAGQAHGQSSGAEINGDGVTFRDVALEGPYVSLYVVGTDFTWRGGRLGADGRKGGQRSPGCDGGNGDGQPVWIEQSATGATLDGIRFNPQGSDQTPRSCSENGFHLEDIRIEAAQDVAIRNIHFMPGSEAGSGHVFVTSASPSATAARGLVLENTIFTPVEGTYALQVNPNVTICDWGLFYNTLMQPFLLDCDNDDALWTGNLGPEGDLGVAADGTLDAGSPAIDAAEQPGEGDVCTGRLGALDFEGDARPSGPACDAGADERSA
jgi:hypothetical protein